MNLNIKLVSASLTATAALSVCTIEGVSAQDVPAFIPPGPVAPKMLSDSNAAPKDRKWSNAENFGTIPARLRADATRECAGMGGEYKPVGYHPDALDKDGKLITGGGFLCLTQETMDLVSKAQKK
jgi:hypothetical protein